MSPRRNGNGPPTPRIIIVPASPPTTSSPTTADSDEEECFSPMSISPTSPRATLIAPPRRFRRLLPAPGRPYSPLQPQPLQQPLSQPLSQQSKSLQTQQQQQQQQQPQPEPQQPQQQPQQPHPEPRTTHPLSPAFPPSRPFQFHTFIPSPPPSPPSPSSPPPPPPLPSPPENSPPPSSPTTRPPLKRLKPNPLPLSISKLIPPHQNPFTNPSPNPLPPANPKQTPSLKSKSNLAPLLTHLRTKLHPLVSSTTGQSHPSFPQTLLAFHCLTHAQLDSLARHFHQVYPPVAATEYYPITVPPWVGTEGAEEVDLEVKRRRFGRFIGLRGCESPTFISSGQGGDMGEGKGKNAWVEMAERRRRIQGRLERLEIEGFGSGGDEGGIRGSGEGAMEEVYQDNGVEDVEMPSEERETPEEMLARMAREWDAAMERAKWDSNFALRWKMGG